jgi:hypothetical protein
MKFSKYKCDVVVQTNRKPDALDCQFVRASPAVGAL